MLLKYQHNLECLYKTYNLISSEQCCQTNQFCFEEKKTTLEEKLF